ncbi:MAG: hypothetical protein IT251_04705 [Chitinophagaceae bacterium]|nr:hypothetical protein [Chitinophagaceae bacterium]
MSQATTPVQQQSSLTTGLVGAGGNIVSSLIDNIFGASDKKKRREFEQALAMLTNQQQQNLNLALLQANTATDRMAILTNAVLAIKQQQLSNADSSSNKKLYIVLAAVGLLVLTMLIIK